MTLLPADLYALGRDLRLAAIRHRRRHTRRAMTVGVVVVATATAGVAVAASTLLGRAAPRAVQGDLASAVHFALVNHPNLDVHTAHVVAASPSATLYSLVAKNGDYCAELLGASHGAIYGFNCSKQLRSTTGQLLADAYAPGVSYFDASDGTSPPVVQFGRLPASTVAARAVFGNGEAETIRTGLQRFFVYEPSDRYQPLARRMPMTVEFRDRSGTTSSYYLEPPQPLRVEGRRISGRVLIERAARVELDVGASGGVNPARIFVPIHADGTFAYTRPPGSVVYRLTVRDAEDNPVSADTGVVTLSTIRREFAAMQRR